MSSWLSSLQGRAENFLEQVDQVAADRLSIPGTPGKAQGDDSPATAHRDEGGVASSPSSSANLTLVNGSETEKRREASKLATRASTLGSETSRLNGAASSSTNGASTAAAIAGSSKEIGSSGGAAVASTATPLSAGESSHLANENRLLKNEIAALEDEIASFSSRIRASQDALAETKESLVSARQQLTEATSARSKLNTENGKLRESLGAKEKEFGSLQATVLALQEQARVATQQRDAMLAEQVKTNEAHARALEALRAELDTARGSSASGEAAVAAAQQQHTERIRGLEVALNERDKQLRELTSTLELAKSAGGQQAAAAAAARAELETLQREHAEYKTRAARILQSKEKVIGELRGEGGAGSEGAVADAEHLRRQHDALRAEFDEAQTQIAELTAKLQEQTQQHAGDAEWAEARIGELEQALRDEKTARADADSQREAVAREAATLQDELRRSQQSAQAAMAARQLEMDALQAQLARRPGVQPGVTELEQRLRTVTDALVQKQAQLEAAAAEKNSLALQLETERRRQREETRVTIVRPEPVQDSWEEARTRGAFASGSADTPIVRRVKDAANVLDAFSIRLGVFLRRFPAARIFVMLYMALLHTWVMIVLLTYTPEMHSGELGHHVMPGAPSNP
eukprot:m.232945 g.232945  ORF g.232945 m.232945 type:complete len:636 (+) comp18921_c0_seq1:98-2005(+)